MSEYWEDEEFIQYMNEEHVKELAREASIRIEESNMSKVQKDAERLMWLAFPGVAIDRELRNDTNY